MLMIVAVSLQISGCRHFQTKFLVCLSEHCRQWFDEGDIPHLPSLESLFKAANRDACLQALTLLCSELCRLWLIEMGERMTAFWRNWDLEP